ncbi:MAG: hypothetical protein JW860_00970 [Sedimentisphaerales bacterium]|nr:hypothetical protein [Sedimentisphaerales bacterium]
MPKRKKLKIFLGVLFCLLILCGAGLLNLPRLLPTSAIKKQLEKQLSQLLGREVNIASLSISWSEGIQVETILVKRREGFAPGHFIRIRNSHCPFNLGVIRRRRIDTLNIERLEIDLVLDEEGCINAGDLKPWEWEMTVPEINVKDLRVNIVNLSGVEQAGGDIRLDSVQIRSGREDPAQEEQGTDRSEDKTFDKHRHWSFTGKVSQVNSPTLQAQGITDIRGDMQIGPEQTWNVNVLLDATEEKYQLKIRDFQIKKPKDDSLRIKVSAGATEPDKVHLEKCAVILPDTGISMEGVLEGVGLKHLDEGKGKGQKRVTTGTFNLKFQSRDFAAVRRWCDVPAEDFWNKLLPGIKLNNIFLPGLNILDVGNGSGIENLSGQCRAEARLFVQFSPTLTCYLEESLTAGSLALNWGGFPLKVVLDNLQASSTRLVVEGLHVNLGSSQMTLIADLREPFYSWSDLTRQEIRPQGRIDLLADTIDGDELACLLNYQSAQLNTSLSEDKILDLLQGCDLDGSFLIDRLKFTDPRTHKPMQPEQVQGRFHLVDGNGRLDYQTALNGGVIIGNMEWDATDSFGFVHHTLNTRQLQADDTLQAVVELELPLLEVNGTISDSSDLSCSLTDLIHNLDKAHWSGTGKTVINEGILYGPGGPGWMIDLIGGLEQVEYRLNKMVNRYELSSDGIKKNHLLFRGEKNDIYIQGRTRPISGENEYTQLIAALDLDRQESQNKLTALELGKLRLKPHLEERLRRRGQGLEELWQRHLSEEHLSGADIDYIVGGLLGSEDIETIENPDDLIHIPFYRARGYIIDRYMVGLKTFGM